jgi:2-polyprenyl-3-methyl-5-hydroxy-6-metoxy-1,4-benzoquinol methylase
MSLKNYLDKDKAFTSIEKKFGPDQVEEAYKLIRARLKLNKIKLNIIKNKNVLDIGCGTGRYSEALKKIGAKSVTCFDNGPRPKQLNKKFNYIEGYILNVKLKKKYDFIFCNGRLSHIKNWKKGLNQISKFLKKDGWLWLSLFGSGPHWNYADKIRSKVNQYDRYNFEKALLLRDWEPHKVFFLIDLFFTQQRTYFTKKKIKNELLNQGYKKIKFLKRGVKKDLNEKIFRKPRLKRIYGEGEIRLIAQK